MTETQNRLHSEAENWIKQKKSIPLEDWTFLAVVLGLETNQFLYGKKVFSYWNYQALEPLIRRKRRSEQNSDCSTN